MKKIIALLMTCLMAVSLAACSYSIHDKEKKRPERKPQRQKKPEQKLRRQRKQTRKLRRQRIRKTRQKL